MTSITNDLDLIQDGLMNRLKRALIQNKLTKADAIIQETWRIIWAKRCA